MEILISESVSKRYFKKLALDGININIESGKIVGLLGPNGSGKTTFLKIVSGLIRPSSGNITICGNSIGHVTKNLVAYLPDSEFLYPWMKISEAKKVYTEFFEDFNHDKFDELLKFMNLEPEMRVKELSKGMKEKLALSLTMARNAKLTILDEPLNGVDPVAREQILGTILKGFNAENAILITSHLINEIESILDEVYFLKQGKIEYFGMTDDIRGEKNMTLDEVYREVFAC